MGEVNKGSIQIRKRRSEIKMWRTLIRCSKKRAKKKKKGSKVMLIREVKDEGGELTESRLPQTKEKRGSRKEISIVARAISSQKMRTIDNPLNATHS